MKYAHKEKLGANKGRTTRHLATTAALQNVAKSRSDAEVRAAEALAKATLLEQLVRSYKPANKPGNQNSTNTPSQNQSQSNSSTKPNSSSSSILDWIN